jgi:hypothetical protein
MKKILNEGNQTHNFISSSGSDFLTSYGSSSGSNCQKITVPVPQRCLQLQLAVPARRHSMPSNTLPPLSNDLDHFRTLKEEKKMRRDQKIFKHEQVPKALRKY